MALDYYYNCEEGTIYRAILQSFMDQAEGKTQFEVPCVARPYRRGMKRNTLNDVRLIHIADDTYRGGPGGTPPMEVADPSLALKKRAEDTFHREEELFNIPATLSKKKKKKQMMMMMNVDDEDVQDKSDKGMPRKRKHQVKDISSIIPKKKAHIKG